MALGKGRFQVRLFRFFVRLSRSQVGHSQRPAGAGRVTCGRGSLGMSDLETRLNGLRLAKGRRELRLRPQFSCKGKAKIVKYLSENNYSIVRFRQYAGGN